MCICGIMVYTILLYFGKLSTFGLAVGANWCHFFLHILIKQNLTLKDA